jgi:hypothetical protein
MSYEKENKRVVVAVWVDADGVTREAELTPEQARELLEMGALDQRDTGCKN